MTSGIKPTDYRTQVKIFEAAGCSYARSTFIQIRGKQDTV